MASLSSQGIGSGLDIAGLVSKLMAVEQIPLTAMSTKEAKVQAKISSYGQLKSALSTLQTAIASLTDSSSFNTKSVSVGSSAVATATTTSEALAGVNSLEVTQLAKAQSLKSNAVWSSAQTTVGTGTLTFDFGTYSGGSFTQNASKGTKTVTIDSSQNSLIGIRDAINAADVGVSASLVYDGTGYRLMMTSDDTGAANALRISTSDSGLASLQYDATGSTSALSQTTAAQDAQLNINGLAITRDSNTVEDAITGVTLQLVGTNVSAPTSVTVSRSTTGIESAVNSFVTAYNSMSTTLSTLTAYNATTKVAGNLLGDATTLSIESQLKRVVNQPLSYASGGLTYLSDIGISFKKDGTLTVDSTKLESVLSDTSKDVGTLFASIGKTTDSLVSYMGSTTSTKPGSYNINVTQMATHGKLTGTAPQATQTTLSGNQTLTFSIDGVSSTITLANGTYNNTSLLAQVQAQINGNSTFSTSGAKVTASMSGTQGTYAGSSTAGLTITSSNNVFDISVDGVAAASSITIPAGTYTAASLAAQVQSSINADTGFAAAGISVSVSQSNGILSIKSNRYGSTSAVTLTDSVAGTVSNLFGSSPSATAGTGTAAILLTSDSYGSASKINMTGGTGATSLFGAATLDGTAGKDVAGTIGATTDARRASSTGSVALATSSTNTITAGVNDTLDVIVDGTAASITLTAGTYTASTLAALIQTQINADSGLVTAGSSVTVSLDSSNHLAITSDKFGANSNVSTSGTAATDFIGTATNVAGLDAVGGTASGFGQQLTAAIGNAVGLKLIVSAGALGSRGTVNYDQGIASRFDTTITNLLNSDDGAIAAATTGLNKTITSIGKQRTALQARLVTIQARYTARFNALDSLIANMQSTSTYLTQQLANLPSSSSSN